MEIKTINDFKKNIKNIESLVLIYGQEKTIINETINLIYNLIDQFREINISIYDGENITIDSIINACETTPFMSNRKIVHIKNAQHIFLNNSISNELSKYINTLSNNTILLFSCYTDIDKSNNLYKAIRNKGMIVEYKKLKGLDLQNYIFNYLSLHNKSITKSNLLYLTSELSAGSENIDLELNKLIDFLGEKRVVEKDDIDSIVTKSIENNVFKLIDFILNKDVDNAIRTYKNMIFLGEEEIMILYMIFRNFKIMYLLKVYFNNYDEVIKKYNIKDFALKNYLRFLKNYSLDEIVYAIKRCYLYDIKIKTGDLQSENGVENLIIELCA